jgi:hypothetical protein
MFILIYMNIYIHLQGYSYLVTGVFISDHGIQKISKIKNIVEILKLKVKTVGR